MSQRLAAGPKREAARRTARKTGSCCTWCLSEFPWAFVKLYRMYICVYNDQDSLATLLENRLSQGLWERMRVTGQLFLAFSFSFFSSSFLSPFHFNSSRYSRDLFRLFLFPPFFSILHILWDSRDSGDSSFAALNTNCTHSLYRCTSWSSCAVRSDRNPNVCRGWNLRT